MNNCRYSRHCAVSPTRRRYVDLIARWGLIVVVIFVLTSSSAGFAQFPLRGGNRTFEGGSRVSQVTRTNGSARSSVGTFPTQSQPEVSREESTNSFEKLSSTGTTHSAKRIQSAQDPRLSVRDVTRGTARSGQGSLDVSPRTFDTSRSSDGDHNSSDETAATVKPSSRLKVTDGQYDFLRVVSADQLSSFSVPSDGAIIVLPRRNFLIADKELAESEQKSNVRASSQDASKQQNLTSEKGRISALAQERPKVDVSSNRTPQRTGELPNDYVVFSLTNLNKDEQLLLRDAQNGRWDSEDLLNASLIAEGLTTQDSRAHYRSRFETLLAALKSQTNDMSDELMKTERVYNFLHSSTLVSAYNLNCSSVAASLDSGVFNCVSATVLFNCFASRVGLEVAALETTGHAKSRVKYDDSYLDIETTCASWDSLPDHIQAYPPAYVERRKSEKLKSVSVADERYSETPADSLPDVEVAHFDNDDFPEETSKSLKSRERKATGRVSFKPVVFDDQQTEDQTPSSAEAFESGKDYPLLDGYTTFTIDADAPMGHSFTRTRRPMHEISDVELVATIYYNVGVDRYQSGDYESAIVSYIKAAQLAPNNLTILGNLKATLNNWAIDVATKEKKYSTAIRITELGLKIDPDFHEFNMNMPIFFRDWIEHLAKDNKWDEVQRVHEEYWRLFPKDK